MTRVATLLAALLLAGSGACTSGGHDALPPDPNVTGLPPIATDACPAPGTPTATSGQRLPDIVLSCIGTPAQVRLSGLGGTPMVLNLWASWCDPCAQEMPAIQRVHTALGSKVQILGIDINDAVRDARQTIQGTGISYPSVYDPQDLLRKTMRLRKIQPLTLLVDATGRVVDVHFGPYEEQELLDAITTKLGVSA